MPTNSKYYYYHKKPAHKAPKIYFCECGQRAFKWESGCWVCADCLRKDEVYRAWRRREAMRGMKPCTAATHGRATASWEF